MDLITVHRDICLDLREKKYALVTADEFSIAPELATDRRRLWEDWATLEPDDYLENDSSFRRRRFGLFYFVPNPGELLPLLDASYFQSNELNPYAGGIDRKFAPLSGSTLTNAFLYELISFNFRQLPVERSMACHPWKVDVHQIRIVASPEEKGEPTPEGIHRDGEDFVCIHMIRSENVVGGVSTVYDNDRNPLVSCTLRHPMDAMLLWDQYVLHGVTPIAPKSPDKVAFRDVLLIGYVPCPDLKRPA
ncbi:MAG: 2OG-Fe dioxygenase family protein [Armatimonadetes bacterium]|nr:2OG-Fe dioxygenase family protein [Armatimonadota bacterium]